MARLILLFTVVALLVAWAPPDPLHAGGAPLQPPVSSPAALEEGPAPLREGKDRPVVALVLGGGSARGFSHIGLLKAFAEEGIPVDMLVGTSMGSLIAGLYAAGLSADNIEYAVTHIDLGQLFTPLVPPRGGLVNPSRLEHFLDHLLEHATFDDVKIPYYSVVTHLQTGEEVILNQGPLARAMVASAAIPGVFPPVEIDGEYYVDGGVVSMVPVRAARQLGADVVIAVSVHRVIEPVQPDDILAVLDLTLDHLLGHNIAQQLVLADVVIHPQVDSDSYMDYNRAEHFIAEGYRAAKEAMPQVRAVLLQRDPDFPFGIQPPPPGIPHEVFARRMAAALAESQREDRRPRWSSPPQVVLRTDQGPIVRLGMDFPLGRDEQGQPFYGFVGRERGAPGWTNTVGVGAGTCGALCAGVFGRQGEYDAYASAGLILQGAPRDRWQYRLEWEHRPDQSPAWNLDFSWPRPEMAPARGREWQLRVGQDPRGLYGPVHEEVRAEAVFRSYFPASKDTVTGFLRSSTFWFAGAGAGVSFRDAAEWSLIGEAGILWEGRLFGLLPLRSRLALVYSGSKAPWSLRWTFGR